MTGRQRLADFIARQGSQADFARKVECSESHLSLILMGRAAGPALAARISKETGGVVFASELVSAKALEARDALEAAR